MFDEVHKHPKTKIINKQQQIEMEKADMMGLETRKFEK